MRKFFSTMAARRVKSLLMGGTACVFYAPAEGRRDPELAALARPENLERLRHSKN